MTLRTGLALRSSRPRRSLGACRVNKFDLSVRLESVTYVLGIICHPCDRNIPLEIGSSGWIRTSNPPVNRRKKKR